MKQVTGAYLDGVNEGRAFLKANPWLTVADMERLYQTAKRLAATHSYAMKDCFKGEADFWKHQIKKKG